MTITQQLVDRIIARARASDFGLGKGLTHKQGHNQIDQYADRNLQALGMLLINGWDAKYDLISIVCAALEEVTKDQLLTLLLAQAESELTEGQIASITGLDRIAIRQARLDAVTEAQRQWAAWREENPAHGRT